RIVRDRATVERAEPAGTEAVLPSQHEVVGHRILEDEPAPVPVFRDVREAGVPARAHVERREFDAAQPDAAVGHRAQAREGLEQLGLAVAFDTRDAQDLAGRDAERDAVYGAV